MAEKIKKSIPWFLVLALIGLVIGIGLNLGQPEVEAVSPTAKVTVGNVLPEITVDADDSSDCDGPTNVGDVVTFTITAKDINSETWKVLVCKTAITEPEIHTACGDGEWCASTPAGGKDPSSASCDSAAMTAGDYNTGTWYAYACDSTGCTADLNTNQPFIVNRKPTFESVDGAAADPGNNVVFTTTASDPDDTTDGCTADEVKLFICADDSGATASGCSGTELCHAILASSAPTCSYEVPIPTPHGSVDYYPYVFDTHGMPAGGDFQGVVAQYTVNDVAPTITSVDLNGGTDITLDLKPSTTNVAAVSTNVTDNNGYADITGGVTAVIYLTSETDSCTADDDNCYHVATENCFQSNGEGATCTYTCTATFKYYADPTDANSAWSADIWSAKITASDEVGSGSKIGDTPVNLITNTALDVPQTEINYGTVAAGGDTGSENQTTMINNYGNSPIDIELYGVDMNKVDNGVTIDVGQQHYALSAFTYGTDDTPLKLVEEKDTVDIEATKPTSDNENVTDDVLWGIEIPAGKPSGDYETSDTFTAVIDTDNWPAK